MSQHPDQESTILFQAMNSPRLVRGFFCGKVLSFSPKNVEAGNRDTTHAERGGGPLREALNRVQIYLSGAK